jgi:zinc transporter 1/2/3
VLQQDDKADNHLQALIMSYTLEAGVIFHSIFIGTGYGAATDPATVHTLTVALAFHQCFEGLALGSSFVAARYGVLKYALLSAAFVLVTPVGVAIGLAVNASYNPNSPPALVTEGVFNALSAGILIHTAIVGLLHPMFAPTAGQGQLPHKGWLLFVAMLFAFLGTGGMAVIGIWA